MNGLVEVLDTWWSAKLETLHTCLPGKILKYEGHKTRRALVQPSVRLELGTGPVLEIPPIDGVPVVFPSCGESSILFPIKPGDGCLILFTEAGIGKWLNGKGEIADPDDQGRFSLTDAVAIPGLWTFRNAPVTKAPEDALFLSHKGASITLRDQTFSVTDSKGNTIESSGSTVTINGNLEVDQ